MINVILKRNGFDELETTFNKKQWDLLVDKFIENEGYYNEHHDRILTGFTSIISEIKTSFFMTDETRELLQYKFNKISEETTKMREVCLFNMAVFSAFIYVYESNDVMISEIESY